MCKCDYFRKDPNNQTMSHTVNQRKTDQIPGQQSSIEAYIEYLSKLRKFYHMGTAWENWPLPVSVGIQR